MAHSYVKLQRAIGSVILSAAMNPNSLQRFFAALRMTVTGFMKPGTYYGKRGNREKSGLRFSR